MKHYKDPGCAQNCFSDTDYYVFREFNGHWAVQARMLAWKFGIAWHRTTELSVDLSTQRTNTSPPECFGELEACDVWYNVGSQVSEAFQRCGSPIEELFLAALVTSHSFRWDYDEESRRVGYLLHWPDQCLDSKPDEFELFSQMPISGYRADFAFVNGDKRLVVELDGHDFHERTREQAARDKSRDRALLSSGWPVMRFTGSEVWSDPHRCTREAISLVNPLPVTPKEEA